MDDPTTPLSSLRQRRGVSFTDVPDGNGIIVMEETPIPSRQQSEEESPVPSKVLSGSDAVAKDENRKRKILVRVTSGALMVSHESVQDS